MNFDENEFFRKATLQICSSLDIDKALLNFLEYIRPFLPVFGVGLSLVELGTGTLRGLVIFDRDGNKQSLPSIQLSREAIRELESKQRYGDTRIVDWKEEDAMAKILRPYLDLSKHSILAMDLTLEGKRLGFFSIFAEGKTGFTQEHIDLFSLLKEPFSIAMSNALRYEELVKLKDILDAENRELSREIRGFSSSDIIGAEYGLKGAMVMVRQVAPLDSPVILMGETGVGKEVVANLIHHTSPRRGGPFVKVNCGAIPENLIDSELFGHERGAFTGAITQRKGASSAPTEVPFFSMKSANCHPRHRSGSCE